MILIYILEVKCKDKIIFLCCFLILTLRKVTIENQSIGGNQSHFK